MNPTKLLKNFLQSGTAPKSQRDQSALLDESRSLLVSQLPTTGHHISNFSDGEIDQILAGGKGAMGRAAAIHYEKYANASPMSSSAAPTSRPASRPAKQDRISELCAYITQPKKPLSSSVAKTTQTPPNKSAEEKAANKFTAVTVTACGITSHSQRGGRAAKQSQKSN